LKYYILSLFVCSILYKRDTMSNSNYDFKKLQLILLKLFDWKCSFVFFSIVTVIAMTTVYRCTSALVTQSLYYNRYIHFINRDRLFSWQFVYGTKYDFWNIFYSIHFSMSKPDRECLMFNFFKLFPTKLSSCQIKN
jgi:hypothetical protein